MIHSLGKMKLTTDEEEVIEVSDEGRQEEIESCAQSLLGKFLTCRPFNKNAATNTVKKAWGLEAGVQILEVGSNLFQFKFQTEFEMERVMRGGPWTFDNQALMLCKWQKGMTARNVKFDSIPMWVQIWDAPFDMISPKVAAEVGRRLGVVAEVEKRQKAEAQCLFMRVRVAIPISKPIRRGSFVAGSDGTRHWVNFKYERLALFCHFCGTMGHDLRHCASYYVASKNSGEVECQYGDWMKATGGRSSLPTRNTTNNVEEGLHQTYKRRPGRQQAKPMNGKPDMHQTEEETRGKGNDAISETVPDIQETITEINEEHVTDFATRKSDDADINTEAANSEIQDMMTESNVRKVWDSVPLIPNHEDMNTEVTDLEEARALRLQEHEPVLDKPIPNGPANTKPKWTRILRMDSGLKGLSEAEPKHILGKRKPLQITEEELKEDVVGLWMKRGKTQEEDTTHAAAGVMAHPCRSQ